MKREQVLALIAKATPRPSEPVPPMPWRVSLQRSRGADQEQLGFIGHTMGEVVRNFSAWRKRVQADYYSVTFWEGVSVVPLHNHFDPTRLIEVERKMKILGPPRIRAHHDVEFGCWYALEGTHRLWAADILGLAPVLVPSRWPRGRQALLRARYRPAVYCHSFQRVTVETEGR